MGCDKTFERHNSTERLPLRENSASRRDARSVKQYDSMTNIP